MTGIKYTFFNQWTIASETSIQERLLFQEKDRFPAHGWGVANVSLDLTNWPDTQGHTPARKTSYALSVTRGL